MSKVIVVTSGKGGVGKTTSTASLGAHHQIEIAKSDVEIDDANPPTALRERRPQRRRRGGFAYTTLS